MEDSVKQYERAAETVVFAAVNVAWSAVVLIGFEHGNPSYAARAAVGHAVQTLARDFPEE